MTTSGIEIHRGLSGVYLDRTESCFIDGQVGKLLYRGYNIHDLAEKSTFEEVIYLLLYGKLPTQAELDGFDQGLRAEREIPSEIVEIIDKVKAAHPMDVLRTAVSALAAFRRRSRGPFRRSHHSQGAAPYGKGHDHCGRPRQD